MDKKPTKTPKPAKTAGKNSEVAAFATSDLLQTGHGTILVAVPSGKTRAKIATFVVDTQCLGIRKITLSELPLATLLNEGLSALRATPIQPEIAFTVLFYAVAYAQKLGFQAPPVSPAALGYFGTTPLVPLNTIPLKFGKDGHPHYVQQHNDTDEFAENVIQKLNQKLGPGNFTYELKAPEEQWVDGEENDTSADPDDAYADDIDGGENDNNCGDDGD